MARFLNMFNSLRINFHVVSIMKMIERYVDIGKWFWAVVISHHTSRDKKNTGQFNNTVLLPKFNLSRTQLILP